MNDITISLEGEEWKPWPGVTGAEVSSFGRIRVFWTLENKGKGCFRIPSETPRPFGTHMTPRGYIATRIICDDGVSRTIQIHRLVLEAFVGPCPDGHECCHRDGCRTNPRLDNLYWGTRRENVADMVRQGRSRNQKITEEQMDEAVALVLSGMTSTAIAKKFGVNQKTISQKLIRRGIRRQTRRKSPRESKTIAVMDSREGLGCEPNEAIPAEDSHPS